MGLTPNVITTVEQLSNVIKTIRSVGKFAFDVETRGNLHNHPDMVEYMLADWKDHLSTLKSPSSEIAKRAKDNYEERYTKMLALDPLRNEVFWIGLASAGISWAIPMGHKLGTIIKEEEIGTGTTVPPKGYRKILKNGDESGAKAKYIVDAVHGDAPTQLSKSVVFEQLRTLFFDDSIVKIGHNVKFDARSISKYYGEMPVGPFADTMLMQHLVNENMLSYSLEQTIMGTFENHNAYYLDGKLGKVIDTVSFDKATRYVHLDARWTWMIYQKLWRAISSQEGLTRSFYQDSQVLSVLMGMENEGITVNGKQLSILGTELDKKLKDILNDLSKYTPIGFNPDSTLQKQKFLFNKKKEGGLSLTPYKKTSTGQPSVDEESLRHLEHKHPSLSLLLDWAETKKLKSTYVDGLLPKLNNSKLHPSFHLHRTSTGRMSSSDPNLQNIPRDSSIRNLFVAPDGHTLIVADYDQIELRVMAMYSQDKEMLRIFSTDTDIHAGAAALLYGKDVKDITLEERQVGKGANFLTAYGGGAGKLSRTTGLSYNVAQEMIDLYYLRFSGLTAWKKSVISKCKTVGYIETFSGRRRRLPNLSSKDQELRARAERQAVNAIVQGSAADLCKQAMIDVEKLLGASGVKILLQIHDELVASVPTSLLNDSLIFSFVEAMGEGRVLNGVPLRVTCSTAETWAEAKK